ncbi:U-box domain-containing protein 73 [Triticum aestivum]|uniref:U-box domain-containing protein 73 n=1 Tax=Triticum aestivum TaxID=4565 RepID=UPI000843EC07|nr:U-box domain-containing protein 73-like [Triticum aestivum]
MTFPSANRNRKSNRSLHSIGSLCPQTGDTQPHGVETIKRPARLPSNTIPYITTTTSEFRSHLPSQTQNKKPSPIASRSQAIHRRARNQEAAMSGRRNRGGASAPLALAPGPGQRPPPPSQSSRRPAAATLEQRLLSSVQREIDDARAMQRAEAGQGSSSLSHSTSAPASSRSRFWPRARQAARKVLGISKKPSARSAAGTPHGQDTVAEATGTSESAAVAAARTGTGDEARSEQQPVEVARTRSEFAAMMQTALAKIQEGAAADDQAQGQAAFDEMDMAMAALAKIQEDAAADDEDQGQAAFAEMEKAMTGLMDLSHKKTSGPPKLPRDFATKWPHSDGDPLLGRVMKDPIILASGYTVDKSCQQWSLAQKNTCPVTGHSLPHSLTAPNHLLHDMIAEWCLDHSNLARSSIGRSLPLVPPAEDEIQEILELFSGHSVRQKEALRMLNLMSKTSKGMQPCLAKWPELTPLLMDLRKQWMNVWSADIEALRISLIHNLSMHRPNREILACQNEVPAVLKNVVERAGKLGLSASLLAMVASIIATLSEFDVFRKRMVTIGGMKMLSGLLKIEDVVLRKETGAAILALCADEEAKLSAAVSDVPDKLLECFMATDEFLLLLNRLPKSPEALDMICDKAMELVNIVMEEDAGGMVTSQGIHSAISLIFVITERDVGKLKVKNVEDFKERLRELSSKRMPMQTMFQVEKIIKALSEMFPAPATQ